MKTKTINLYEYSELAPKAKEKALKNWNDNNFDDNELLVYLDNEIESLLKKHKITPIADIKGYSSKYAKIYYSLACCQGDGVMFEGVFNWETWTVKIKHEGHYYHSNSKSIEMHKEIDGQEIEPSDAEEAEFEAIYQSICKELEKFGYQCTEDMQSEESFIETCNGNEYTFREDGTMEN